MKMEFRRKELDTETKKYKEEQYLITYMFGRKDESYGRRFCLGR